MPGSGTIEDPLTTDDEQHDEVMRQNLKLVKSKLRELADAIENGYEQADPDVDVPFLRYLADAIGAR